MSQRGTFEGADWFCPPVSEVKVQSRSRRQSPNSPCLLWEEWLAYLLGCNSAVGLSQWLTDVPQQIYVLEVSFHNLV